jgi:hypothetical protein
VNTAGTFIPQVALSASTEKMLASSYFRMWLFAATR